MKKNFATLFLVKLICVADLAYAQFPFYESFDDNSKNWSFVNQSHNDYVMQTNDGHLYLESKNKNAIQTFKYVGFDGKSEYQLNARMIFLGGDANDLNAVRWGMSSDGNNYYVFGFTDGGQYYIGKKQDKLKSMVNFAKTPVIKAKDYNLLQVRKEGNWCIFKINGQEVYRAKDLDWFGDGLALKCPPGSRLKIDYVSITDPVKDKANMASINNILFGGTTPPKTLKKAPVVEVPLLPALPVGGSADFKEFMNNFELMNFPTKIHPREKKIKGKDISNLSFVRQFYEVTNDFSVSALSKISNCADGYLLLLAHKQSTSHSENTEFFLHKFSQDGRSLGSQKIGRLEYMNKSFYYTTDLDFSYQNNVVSIVISGYYHQDRKDVKTLTFNQNFCTF